MWNATIVSKEYRKGVLLVGIEFTNGTEVFSKSLDLTGGSQEVLDAKIQQELETLNQNESFMDALDVAVATRTEVVLKPKKIENTKVDTSTKEITP